MKPHSLLVAPVLVLALASCEWFSTMSDPASIEPHERMPLLPPVGSIPLQGLPDFDLTNAQALGEQLDRAFDTGNAVIVDLSEATFVDSSVIHVLVRGAKAARARGQALVVQLGTAATVERVFELAGIEQLVPRAHDRQEAVRTIQLEAGAV